MDARQAPRQHRVYVLDPLGEPVPIGVEGELCIGGAGIARGYLHRPDLTAERFAVDRFAGDGTRVSPHGRPRPPPPRGTLQYRGRIDAQVKLRGYRIELGEIEAQLATIQGVAACAVVAREDVPGDTRLVAYVVGDASIDTMRLELATRLPAYMIPNAFVSVEALPLDPSGKVNRRALPAPVPRARTLGFVAPKTPTETLVAETWQRVLGVERVGRDDNFFELGGHSLLAVKATALLREALSRDVSVVALFRDPVLSAFAAQLDASGEAPAALRTVKVQAAREKAAIKRFGGIPEERSHERGRHEHGRHERRARRRRYRRNGGSLPRRGQRRRVLAEPEGWRRVRRDVPQKPSSSPPRSIPRSSQTRATCDATERSIASSGSTARSSALRRANLVCSIRSSAPSSSAHGRRSSTQGTPRPPTEGASAFTPGWERRATCSATS